jgi:chitinase
MKLAELLPQFYNRSWFLVICLDWANFIFAEGTTEYVTCSGLLTKSSSTWPQTALFQIAANGVPLDKLVIGKPGNFGDASNGFITPGTLAGCLQQAKAKGWNAGAMSWEVSV